MGGLNDAPPINETGHDYVRSLVPQRHLQTVLDLWIDQRIPLGSMKLENDLRQAVGINFAFSGFRYDTRRKRRAVDRICEALGVPSIAPEILRAGDGVKKALDLMCSPVEMLGFDVSDREVRQIKAYIRTNWAHERFEDRVIACSSSTPDEEMAALSAVVNQLVPERSSSVLDLLDAMQGTRGALEGLAVDFDGDRPADVKLYFFPRRLKGIDEAYTDEETMAFVERSLEMFGLGEHRDRARRMMADMNAIGLRSSFLAVEQKQDGSHELKVDFNTSRSDAAFPDRRVTASAAADAIRAAYRAAQLPVDEDALLALTSMIGPQGILLDDFTTDFGKRTSSGKVYLRAATDQGVGVYAAGDWERT